MPSCCGWTSHREGNWTPQQPGRVQPCVQAECLRYLLPAQDTHCSQLSTSVCHQRLPFIQGGCPDLLIFSKDGKHSLTWGPDHICSGPGCEWAPQQAASQGTSRAPGLEVRLALISSSVGQPSRERAGNRAAQGGPLEEKQAQPLPGAPCPCGTAAHN